ncbi:MAG: hypothetical protein ACK4UJ_05165 [Leptonema sp. (in: bacteria)]
MNSIEDRTNPFNFQVGPQLNNCDFGYFYIDANEQGAGGGHTAVKIRDFVYHYQRVYDEFFILDKTALSSFLFDYSRLQNRNLHLICVDVSSYVKEIEDLLHHFEIEYQKNFFILNEILYWRNLLKNLEDGIVYLPTIEYFHFDESGFNQISQEDLDLQIILDNYQGNISFYLLEKYYKNNLINFDINWDSFIQIQNIHSEEIQKKEFKNKLKEIIREWEKRIQELESSKREDRYLVILESLVYIQTLKIIYSKETFWVPCLIVDKTNQKHDILEKSINISLLDSGNEIQIALQNQMIIEIQKLITKIKEKLPLTEIQFTLQKISYLANQILLLNKNQDFKRELFILNSPQIVKRIKITHLKNYKNELSYFFEKNLNRYLENSQEILEYDLITKNCVTKLFYFISNHTKILFLKELYNSNDQVFNTLYGNFIPWISFIYFKKILKRNKLPFKEYEFFSFRNELLEELRKEKKNTIKEISTITSDFYSFNSNDSFFIFFTEDSLVVRPVLGLINFTGSLTYFIVDLIKQPYDIFKKEDHKFYKVLSINLSGIFFSMTEILFFSIRKGTFFPNQWYTKYQKLFFLLPFARNKV